MRVVSFHALPFHRWLLAGVEAELRRRGCMVQVVAHTPAHDHDWATAPGSAAMAQLAALAPVDLVLAADYPYRVLRETARGPVLTVRHSLAARGNTYELDQYEADYLPIFSQEDAKRLRHTWVSAGKPVSPMLVGGHAGAPWMAEVLQPSVRTTARKLLLHRLGVPDTGLPLVGVATTWNPWTDLAVVERLAADPGLMVVWRPHPAAAWRRPHEAARVRAAGALVDDPLQHPAGLLNAADCLVGDVSGVVLMAACAQQSKLPLVMLDPPVEGLAEGAAQIDPSGPEWTLRPMMGERVRAGDPEFAWRAVRRALAGDPDCTAGRKAAAQHLLDPHTKADSAYRVGEWVVQIGEAARRIEAGARGAP